MKLITWNCQGAFRKKFHKILLEEPDVLVIQECEHPDRLTFKSETLQPTDVIWIGDKQHKGLGIFTFGDFKLKRIDNHNSDIKFVLPVLVYNSIHEFTLVGIWANNPQDAQGQYVEQVWKTVNYYEDLIGNTNTILAGDLNSNSIWDRPRKIGNHSHVAEALEKKHIFSVYHKYLDQKHGEEKDPTFFLQRKISKPYHIDYCFVSDDLMEKLKSFEIGILERWITLSDHLPLMITFEL